jgi:hypothetical protein
MRLPGQDQAWPVLVYHQRRGDDEDLERRVRLRELAAALPGEVVGSYVDRPGDRTNWRNYLAALWRWPGPQRVALTYDLEDVGVGEPDGRFEMAWDVWEQTGGGVAITTRLVLDLSDLAGEDAEMLTLLHARRCRGREAEQQADLLRRARGR